MILVHGHTTVCYYYYYFFYYVLEVIRNVAMQYVALSTAVRTSENPITLRAGFFFI